MKKFEKIFFSMIAMIMMVAVGSVFTSCSNDDDDFPVTTETQLDQALGQDSVAPMTRGISSVTYFTKPSSGFVPNSVGTLPAVCGTGQYIYGGAITAGVSKSGNNLTVLVKKQNAFETFSQAGTAYLKYAHPCGSILDSNPYFMGAEYVMLSYNIASPGLTQGCYWIYPMVKNSLSPYNRYYANPIMVYTTPMHATANSDDVLLGTVNGVQVRSNGSTNVSSGSNQCTVFCKNYLEQVYGRTTDHYLHAKYWFTDTTNFPDTEFDRYSNGSSSSVGPKPGDILCMQNTYANGTINNNKNGHVAIIIEVADSYIKIAQQNSGYPDPSDYEATKWQHPIGGELDYNPTTKTITAPAYYHIQGWMRYNPS